jgi:hypothetical protein
MAALGSIAACSSDGANPAQAGAAVTYWQDAVPIFENHCMQCHEQGGIAPFRLDDFEEAKAHATNVRAMTQSRSMPPWSATSDGSCDSFSGSLALTDAQIQTLADWVDGGLAEGTSRVIEKPPLPTLSDATDFATPHFAPVRQGGELAEFDEYRCFPLDSGVADTAFITGYEVVPGTPEIVHHVVVSIVDPDAPDAMGDRTNGELMQALDDASPDRLGWPCFSTAGDGVNVNAVPVIWAPGQGVVTFPGQSGVPLRPRDKVVVQVHYNLADAANEGKTDESKVRLRIVSQVENVGLFALYDPLLYSLQSPMPTTLEPGRASVTYSWKRSVAEMGLADVPQLQFQGIMPHMHQLGHKYRLTIDQGSGEKCGIDVRQWDFHWQRMYFYQTPHDLDAMSTIGVTCDFDTSSRTDAVLPGWGTRNEMCLATMYFTAPISVLGNR